MWRACWSTGSLPLGGQAGMDQVSRPDSPEQSVPWTASTPHHQLFPALILQGNSLPWEVSRALEADPLRLGDRLALPVSCSPFFPHLSTCSPLSQRLCWLCWGLTLGTEELWSFLPFVRGHLMINQSQVVSCPLAEVTPVPLYPGAQHCVWLQLCPPDLRWTSSPDPSLRLTGKFSDKQRPRPLGCGPGLSFSCKLVIFSGICSNTRLFGSWVLNLLLHSASFS